MSNDLNDFVWRYVIINQLLNQLLSCAVCDLQVFYLFLGPNLL